MTTLACSTRVAYTLSNVNTLEDATMALQMRQNLNMRMEQKLKLTPQMIQSIEILLLPQMALEERIMNEIESNPALEIDDSGLGEPADRRSTDDSFRGDAQAETGDYAKALASDTTHNDDNNYADWLKPRKTAPIDDDAPDKMAAINATAENPPTLAEHLFDQLRFMDIPEQQQNFAEDICWQLDRKGYLTIALEELFEEEHLEDAEQAWEYVRRCEPIGIGARDLKDCLLLQLSHEPGDNSFEINLIANHLGDVLRNRLPVVAEAIGCDIQRIQDGIEVIAQLDPQPGLPFARDDNHYVIPDVILERDTEKDEAHEWVISIPDSHLPKITVNEDYSALLNDPDADRREKEYLREKVSGAKFIIDAIAQRKRTLLKIVTEIIRHQRAFLDQGVAALRPLMRQDIATIIGMHVATVSRAVKDKYIQTPNGVLPLSDFFSGGIAAQDGTEAESSKSVHLKIHKLIENEDKKKPLSDQAIADILAKDGLDISRRTVTKYRIADGIPSTRQRRVYAG